jgi:hypothetical protein
MGVRFTKSVRKHRIGRGHALFVINSNTPRLISSEGEEENKLMWIGLDDRGLELEVIAVETRGDLVVIHVMPYGYRRFSR